MQDHLHLLLEGQTSTADLRRFIKRAKQGAAQTYSNWTKDGRLWQEGYYDRVLRSEDDAKTIARYIIENPVRAGLVATPLEYPFVGSDVWSLAELIDSVR